MGSLDATTIIVFIIFILIITAVIFGIQALFNKATDGVYNKIIDSKNKKKPPKEESLAERYKQKGKDE